MCLTTISCFCLDAIYHPCCWLLQLQLQLLGVKCHGYKNIGFFYIGGEGMKGSNLTCAAMMYTIQSYLRDRGRLPSKLYVQMDNCAGDNKNHVVFGFLAHLVQLGVFKQVEVMYLHSRRRRQ